MEINMVVWPKYRWSCRWRLLYTRFIHFETHTLVWFLFIERFLDHIRKQASGSSSKFTEFHLLWRCSSSIPVQWRKKSEINICLVCDQPGYDYSSVIMRYILQSTRRISFLVLQAWTHISEESRTKNEWEEDFLTIDRWFHFQRYVDCRPFPCVFAECTHILELHSSESIYVRTDHIYFRGFSFIHMPMMCSMIMNVLVHAITAGYFYELFSFSLLRHYIIWPAQNEETDLFCIGEITQAQHTNTNKMGWLM